MLNNVWKFENMEPIWTNLNKNDYKIAQYWTRFILNLYFVQTSSLYKVLSFKLIGQILPILMVNKTEWLDCI